MDLTPITIKDFIKIKKVSDVRIKDNKIYFVESSTDVGGNTYQSCIKQMDLETQQILQFTSGTKSDSHPRISPDGKKLAFLSTRSEKPQIYVMNINGGEAIAVTKVKSAVQSFDWSPDSRKLVFTARWKPQDDEKKEDNEEGIDPREQVEIDKIKEKFRDDSLVDPRVIHQIIFKTGTSFIDHSRTPQVFVHYLDQDKTQRISNEEYGYGAAYWRGNDRVVVYRKVLDGTVRTDYLVEIEVNDKTETQLYENYNPMIFYFTPMVNRHDTSKVLLSILEKEYFPAPLAQISKFFWLGDDTKIINKEFDRSLREVKFLSENKAYVRVDTMGYSRILLWNLDTNGFEEFYEPDYSAESLDATNSVIVTTGTNPNHPSAIWIKKQDDEQPQVLYDPNAEWLKERKIIQPTTHWMTNEDGVKFQYWVFQPKNVETKPPLMLSIHGGPHVMWNNAGTMWHEWQIQAAMGYLVVAPNPVGSEGYGEEFMRTIAGNWGKADGRDEMKLVKQLIDEGQVDPNRLFTCGGSYAGFQVGHLITTYPDFTAACAQRGVFNLTNLYAGGDFSYFGELEYDGPEWERYEKLWADSPVSKVANVKTPLLMIHSENDFRVPIAQADEFFGALKIHGKKVKYVRYPRDGHELSRSGEPIHLMDRLTKMMDFFQEFL